MVEYSIYMLGILNMIVLYTWRIGRTCTGNILYPLLQSFQFCMALFSLLNNWLSPTFMCESHSNPFESYHAPEISYHHHALDAYLDVDASLVFGIILQRSFSYKGVPNLS